MNCLETKIEKASGPLKPTILSAILKLYKKGKLQISAKELKEECNVLDSTKDWNGRLPAICNGMRNVIDCGWRIITEDRDFNGFTISIKENQHSLNDLVEKKLVEREIIKEKKLKSYSISKTSNQNIGKLDWAKIKDKKRKKLLIIGCSSTKQSGGDKTDYENYEFGDLLNKHRKLRLEYYQSLLTLNPEYFRDHIDRYEAALNSNKLLEAYKRYNGDFYTNNLRELYKSVNEEFNFRILIISGLYGLLDFKDYIKDYHLEIKKGGRKGNDWNNNDISNTILSFKVDNQIEDENVFYCISNSYRNALNPKDNWHNLWVGNDRGRNSVLMLTNFLSEVLS